MPTLYNCHTDGDQYRITKFDSDGNVESSYLTTHDECECPAGQRPTCRHRQMLPIFLAKDAVNSFFFYDWDRKGWVTNEIPEARVVNVADPAMLYNAIADAIGEPRLQAPGHTDLMISPEAINEALQAQPVPSEVEIDLAPASASASAEPAPFRRRF